MPVRAASSAKRRQVGPASGSAVRSFCSGGPRKLVFSGVATGFVP